MLRPIQLISSWFRTAPNMAASVRESTSGSNVDRVSLECNICFELPHEPIATLCGHLFCWPCLYKWLHVHSHSPECPVCKALVEEAKLVPLYGRGKDRVDPRSKNNVPGGAADIHDRRPAMSLKADTNRPERNNRMGKRKEEDMSSDHPDDDDEAAKTAMYLVLEHAVEEPAYSVFRVDAAAAAEDDDGSRRARHLVRIPASQHGMSFAAAYSKRGRSWIVGVGGDTTIYYDPTQECRGFEQGPRPTSAKHDPVLISHGRKLYAFSRRYKVDPDAGYEPWFEYLSVGEEGPGSGFWMDLLAPPFYPFVLTPRQYLDPPEIRVLAYAAVGSYILLSVDPGGTFAFHVSKVTWAKVDEKNLPFVGDAVPLGGNYFASRSRARGGATTVFYIKLKVYNATSSEPARLSVLEFPVASQGIIPGGGQQLLCPLGPGGGGSFCSVDLMSSRHSSRQPGMLKAAQVVVTACQMNVKGETAELQVSVNDEQRQIYRFCDRTRFLASPMPLVAALSMDKRSIEENPRKKKAAPHIFSAPTFSTETSK